MRTIISKLLKGARPNPFDNTSRSMRIRDLQPPQPPFSSAGEYPSHSSRSHRSRGAQRSVPSSSTASTQVSTSDNRGYYSSNTARQLSQGPAHNRSRTAAGTGTRGRSTLSTSTEVPVPDDQGYYSSNTVRQLSLRGSELSRPHTAAGTGTRGSNEVVNGLIPPPVHMRPSTAGGSVGYFGDRSGLSYGPPVIRLTPPSGHQSRAENFVRHRSPLIEEVTDEDITIEQPTHEQLCRWLGEPHLTLPQAKLYREAHNRGENIKDPAVKARVLKLEPIVFNSDGSGRTVAPGESVLSRQLREWNGPPGKGKSSSHPPANTQKMELSYENVYKMGNPVNKVQPPLPKFPRSKSNIFGRLRQRSKLGGISQSTDGFEQSPRSSQASFSSPYGGSSSGDTIRGSIYSQESTHQLLGHQVEQQEDDWVPEHLRDGAVPLQNMGSTDESGEGEVVEEEAEEVFNMNDDDERARVSPSSRS